MSSATSNAAALHAHRAFTRFWYARIFSTSAYQMMSVAVAWQVYDLTRSAFALGVVGLLQFLPKLLLMPVAGNLADRVDRRKLIAAAQAAQCLCLAVLAVATASGFVSLGLIYVVLVVGAIGRAIESPPMQALLPALVPAELLARAVASSGSAFQMATIAAPMAAGFVYGLGAAVVHGIAAALFAGALALVMGIRPLRPQTYASTTASGWHTFLEGLRFVRDNRPVLGALSLDMMAVLLGGATALLPIIAHDVLHTGAWGLGVLRAAPAIGALLTSLWLTRHPLEANVGRAMFGSVAVFGLATIVFGLSTSMWVSLGALLILGAADMVSVVFRGAYVQLATPDSMRGRVGAVNGIFIGASNQLGEFESGVTAAWLGTVPAVVLGGVGTLVVVALWTRWFPDLVRLEKLPVGA